MNKRVALFANGWNGENLDFFINGFNEYFTNNDVDLFVFSSHMLSGHNPVLRDAENSIYDLPDYSFFDAAVVYGAGINTRDELTRFINKCEEADVPLIMQGVDVDGFSSVTIDNYIGMKKLCDHLIEQHGVADVIYIAGDVENGDSNFRLKVLKESLEAHGHELKDENVFYAMWNARIIQAFLNEEYGSGKKKLPDAFVCANDQMALSALSFLEQMGIRVPEDVIVSGFDNLSAGRVFSPSLATVDQDYHMQGFECAKIVAEVVTNKKLIKKSIVPTVISPGESCGCINCKGEIEARKKLGRDFWSSKFALEVMQGRKMHLDMCIVTNERFEDIHKNMNEDFFKTIGQETADFHIYVNPQYKELKYKNVPTGEFVGPHYNPVMEVVAARTDGVIYYEDTMELKNLFLGYDGSGKGKTYIFVPLRIDDSVFGYMVMGYVYGSFEKKKYIEFAGCLKTTFTQYQRNIEDYNRAIKIKEDANIFLQQTVEALASAVDAKDSYTHGHSARVAKYAKKIAQLAGLSDEECDNVYLAGLLHDVGKIGIRDDIINNTGKLSKEDFDIIKQHPVLGDAILEKIHMLPSLSTGARHHHERYDGGGYPDNLKGEEIPQIARIIAVADAYDAMTSKRSYRDVIPQMQVREELVKGIGTQFDPEYAKIMIYLLDLDVKYQMKEHQSEEVIEANSSFRFDAYMSMVSAGLRVTVCPITINVKYESLMDGGLPTLLFYDSADANFYIEEGKKSTEMNFVQFGSLCLDGKVTTNYVRKMQQNTSDDKLDASEGSEFHKACIQVVKVEDHMLVKMSTEERTDEVIFALPDASRYLYMALTGKNCSLTILDINVANEAVESDYVPRIADKVSYIDRATGDIPNIQIDSWRSKSSEVMTIIDSIELNFHTMSIPSAARVWHCPLICLFTSDDGKIGGKNYKEVAAVRLNGEAWSDYEEIINNTENTMDETFDDWDVWKDKNKAGVECKISIQLEGEKVNLNAENSGLIIKNQTILNEKPEKIYCFLTGDQCAITDIHVRGGLN